MIILVASTKGKSITWSKSFVWGVGSNTPFHGTEHLHDVEVVIWNIENENNEEEIFFDHYICGYCTRHNGKSITINPGNSLYMLEPNFYVNIQYPVGNTSKGKENT